MNYQLNVNEVINWGAQILKNNEIEDFFLEANLIFSWVSNFSKEKIVAENKSRVAKGIFLKYQKNIFTRAKNIPLSYLTNSKEFYGSKFYIDKKVFIPRPETEHLIDKARAIVLKDLKLPKNNFIIDIGCGSGIVAITLAKIFKDINFLAVDISRQAVKCTAKNIKLHNVKDNIFLVCGNVLNFLQTEKNKQKIFLIVSNPPYVEKDYLNKNVELKYEPKRAFNGGNSGLTFYRKIFSTVDFLLNKKGRLILEIGYNQTEKIIFLADKYNLKVLEITKDLQQHNRIMVLKKM